MLSWLEHVPIYTVLGYKIIEHLFTTNQIEISMIDLKRDITEWINKSEDRKDFLRIELLNYEISEDHGLEGFLKRIITKDINRKNSGWTFTDLMEERKFIRNIDINFSSFNDEIQIRLKLRNQEFLNLLDHLHHGALYTKKVLKENFRKLGATENLNHFFGGRSQGIVRLESIKVICMFVTIDKNPNFKSEN